MDYDPLNKPREDITINDPKQSLNALLETLKTKSAPKILSDAYSLKISSAIEALNQTKKILTKHNQNNPYFVFYTLFHHLKYLRIKNVHLIKEDDKEAMLKELQQLIDQAKKIPDSIGPRNYKNIRALQKEFDYFTQNLYALAHFIHLVERNLYHPTTNKNEL